MCSSGGKSLIIGSRILGLEPIIRSRMAKTIIKIVFMLITIIDTEIIKIETSFLAI